jgi:GAG-pre-integrase domain
MQHNLFSVTALRRDSGKQLHKDMLGDNCDVMVIRRDGSEYCFAVADKSDGLFWIRASDPGGPDHSPAPAARALQCFVAASSAANVPVEAVTSPAPGSSVAPEPTVSDAAVLWHRRMGHVGYDNLAQLVKSGLVTGVPVSAGDFTSATGGPACASCVQSKHARSPFPSSESKSTAVLELVHMDVCGPYQKASLGGAKYIATFFDDDFKLSVVKPIAYKPMWL